MLVNLLKWFLYISIRMFRDHYSPRHNVNVVETLVATRRRTAVVQYYYKADNLWSWPRTPPHRLKLRLLDYVFLWPRHLCPLSMNLLNDMSLSLTCENTIPQGKTLIQLLFSASIGDFNGYYNITNLIF